MTEREKNKKTQEQNEGTPEILNKRRTERHKNRRTERHKNRKTEGQKDRRTVESNLKYSFC